MSLTRREFVALAACAAAGTGLSAAETAPKSRLVYPGADGRLVYVADELGNTIPDFSNVGYASGIYQIPTVPAVMELSPVEGDNTAAIQAAIDKISQMPLRNDGFRGALLLRKGRYGIAGSLHIRASGVVLRGEGRDDTILVATGKGERSLIEIDGGECKTESRMGITDKYVPVGSRKVTVKSGKDWKPGQNVFVRRVGNQDFLHEIGMDEIEPRPGNGGGKKKTHSWNTFHLDFDRVITAVHDNVIEIDAPIVCAIDERWGGGEVMLYNDEARIKNVGVENLRGESEYNKSVIAKAEDGSRYAADEDHASTMVSIDHAANVWVRNVGAVYFSYSCVTVERGAKWVTVEDCICASMVSQIEGERRYAFKVAGQLALFKRCFADSARHSFVVDSRVCGPNVFFNCKAGRQYNSSEPHHRWSVGGLYDNVKAEIKIQDRQWLGSGQGWAGANYVVWNCEGQLVCQRPPTAQNYAIGQVGSKGDSVVRRPDGYWESHGKHVTPESLYLAQLNDRIASLKK